VPCSSNPPRPLDTGEVKSFAAIFVARIEINGTIGLLVINKAFEVDYDKTVSKAHLEASGWNMDSFKGGNPFDSHCVYIHDVDNKQVNLFTVRQDDFDAYQLPPGAPAGILASLVAESLERYRKGKSQPENDADFVPKLVAYIKATQIFGVWQQQGLSRLHFVINVYRSKKGVNKAMLRPFVASCNETVLPTDDLMLQSTQVLQMDKARHPEWF
jgi:hypothetical protein